jgi:TATA-binding protein-associated factor Taf7
LQEALHGPREVFDEEADAAAAAEQSSSSSKGKKKNPKKPSKHSDDEDDAEDEDDENDEEDDEAEESDYDSDLDDDKLLDEITGRSKQRKPYMDEWDTNGDGFNQEKLRKYELEKLKYALPLEKKCRIIAATMPF